MDILSRATGKAESAELYEELREGIAVSFNGGEIETASSESSGSPPRQAGATKHCWSPRLSPHRTGIPFHSNSQEGMAPHSPYLYSTRRSRRSGWTPSSAGEKKRFVESATSSPSSS